MPCSSMYHTLQLYVEPVSQVSLCFSEGITQVLGQAAAGWNNYVYGHCTIRPRRYEDPE
jgi:hypothetical protein